MPPSPSWLKCEYYLNHYGNFLFIHRHLCIHCRNGRPGSSSVSDRFRIDWGTYMSSRNDVVYIRLDVRGSKGQSKAALFRHLGGVEVEDQILTLK